MTQDDDSPKTDDGKTAMQRYAAWHTENCRCIPVETPHDTDAARLGSEERDRRVPWPWPGL
ncbi:MAG: hypothetical protein WB526_05785 [Candidatus Cybelea sp.]